MKCFKLRVDLEDVSLDSVLDVVMHFSNVYMYCSEDSDGDNPHCHFYLEVDKGSAAVRTKLRSLGLKGNSSYSLKELDERNPVEYLAYMMKGKDWKNCGVPEDIIEEAKNYDKKVKAQMKEKKAQRRTVLQKIEDEYDLPKVWGDAPPTLKQVVSKVVEYHKKSGVLIREFAMVSITQTLCLKYMPSYESHLYCAIFDKVNHPLFPHR